MLGLPPAARPSTSPAPNFVFADLKKLATYGGQAGGGGARGIAAAQAQAAAQSRLRPLPGSSQSVRPSSNSFFGGPMSMMIEGSKTGEEKQVIAVERRESVSVKPSTPLDNGTAAKENQNARDGLRIKKLEAEVRRLQEQVRKRTQDKEDADRRAEDFQGLMDSANRKLIDREKEWTSDLRKSEEQVEHFRSSCHALEARLKQFEEDHVSFTNGSRTAADRHALELKNMQTQMDKMKSEMHTQMEALRQENRQQRDANLALEKRIASAATDAASAQSRFEKELSALRSEASRLCVEGDELRSDMRAKEKMVDEWRTKMDQCRHYIVKICQPQFSVVKDDTLAPVPPGSQEAGGFVLVPLQLMLEGYTLLPPEMKKKIAEEYEANKAKTNTKR